MLDCFRPIKFWKTAGHQHNSGSGPMLLHNLSALRLICGAKAGKGSKLIPFSLQNQTTISGKFSPAIEMNFRHLGISNLELIFTARFVNLQTIM